MSSFLPLIAFFLLNTSFSETNTTSQSIKSDDFFNSSKEIANSDFFIIKTYPHKNQSKNSKKEPEKSNEVRIELLNIFNLNDVQFFATIDPTQIYYFTVRGTSRVNVTYQNNNIYIYDLKDQSQPIQVIPTHLWTTDILPYNKSARSTFVIQFANQESPIIADFNKKTLLPLDEYLSNNTEAKSESDVNSSKDFFDFLMQLKRNLLLKKITRPQYEKQLLDRLKKEKTEKFITKESWLELINSKDQTIAADAFAFLSEKKSDIIENINAFPLLKGAIASNGWLTRVKAINELKKIKSEESLTLILNALLDSHSDVIAAAKNSICYDCFTEKTTKLLISFVQEKNNKNAWDVFENLFNVTKAPRSPLMMQLVFDQMANSSSWGRRRDALNLAITENTSHPDDTIKNQIYLRIFDSNPYVIALAKKHIITKETSAKDLPFIEKMLKKTNKEETRVFGVELLFKTYSTLPLPTKVEKIITNLVSDSSLVAKNKLFEFLAKFYKNNPNDAQIRKIIIEFLKDNNWSIRLNALKQLGDYYKKGDLQSETTIFDMYFDSYSDIQFKAKQLINEFKISEQHIPFIKKLLSDKNNDTKIYGVELLLKFKDPLKNNSTNLLLLQLLNNSSWSIRLKVLRFISENYSKGDLAIERVLIEMILDSNSNVRQAAVQATSSLKITSAHLPSIEKLVEQKNADILKQGVRLLFAMDQPLSNNASTQLLTSCLSNENWPVRYEALAGLIKLYPFNNPVMLKVMLDSYFDTDKDVKSLAKEFINKIPPAELNIEFINKILKQKNYDERLYGLNLLAKLDQEIAKQVLMTVAINDTDNAVRHKAITDLQKHTSDNAVVLALISALGDKNNTNQELVFNTLVKLKLNNFYLKALIKLLNDNAWGVRLNSVRLIKTIGTPEAKDVLKQRLSSEKDQDVLAEINK